YLATEGKSITIDLAAVDTSGTAAPNVPLHANVYQRVWTTTTKQQPDGSRQPVSTPKDTLVASHDLTTGAAGTASFGHVPGAGGEYRVTVQGRDSAGNAFQAASSFYASASSRTEQPYWRIYPESKMDLFADRDS